MRFDRPSAQHLILSAAILFACAGQNHAPVVQSIHAVPSSVPVNGNSILTAIATDEDGDALDYLWEAPSGAFPSGADGSTVTWTAPASPGQVAISVTISDGKSTASRNVTATVTEDTTTRVSVSGHAFYAGTLVPISGVTVSIDSASSTTGSDGRYELDEVPVGRRTITASKADYDPYSQTVDIPKTGLSKDVEMTSGIYTHRVYGTITDAGGDSLSGVRVVVLNPDSSESQIYTSSSAAGYYQVPSVPQGNRTLEFSLPGYDTLAASIYIANYDYEYDAKLSSVFKVATLSFTQDAFTCETLPTTNFGDSSHLYVGGEAVSQQLGYFQFDLSSIPPGDTIDSARVYLWYDVQSDSPGLIQAGMLTESWSEHSISRENSPSLTVGSHSVCTAQGPRRWVDFDVTWDVNAWHHGTANCGMCLFAEWGPVDCAFASREAQSSIRPYVKVYYR